MQKNKEPEDHPPNILSFASALGAASKTYGSRPDQATVTGAVPAADKSYTSSSIRSVRTLPVPLTSLIGRESELEQVKARLLRPNVRLLTLIGPPGVGKTSLALELAVHMGENFPHGVYFVPLASVFDSRLVMTTIARAVNLSGKDTASVSEGLKTFFGDKHLLLVLDNFEQILPTAPLLVELLSSCPHLKLVVTSRAALQVRGEYEFVVQPLAIPASQEHRAINELARVASVALFIERVEAVKPEFQLTEGNAPLVSRICQQLEGMPLAIELAAARCKVLSLQSISLRLEQGLAVLSGIKQDALAHHQSLHDTINWSYELLSPDEQMLFRRLSVFVGNFTLTAAETVAVRAGKLSISVLDGISSLIDKSLLQQRVEEGTEPFLHQLETIRQFGLEQLVAHNELIDCREVHAAYYLALAEQASAAWHGPEEAQWLHALQREYDNIQMALAFFLKHDRREELLRFTGAMGLFWFLRGYLNEGRGYLERALIQNETAGRTKSLTARANALYFAGLIAFWQQDYPQACVWLEESEHIFRLRGEHRGVTSTLLLLGYIKRDLESEQVRKAIHAECLRLCQEAGDRLGLAEIKNVLGFDAYSRGEYDRAEKLFNESRALASELGCGYTLAQNLYFMGRIAFVRNDYELARQRAEESLYIFETANIPIHVPKVMVLLALLYTLLGEETKAADLLSEAYIRSDEIQDQGDKALTLYGQGFLAQSQKDHVRACSLFEESLKILLSMNTERLGLGRWLLPANLEGLGIVAFEQRNITRCVVLFAAAEALRQSSFFDISFNPQHACYRSLMAEVQTILGEDAFTAAWAAGYAMTPRQVLDPAAQEFQDRSSVPPVNALPAPHPSKRSGAKTGELTTREVEVLRLIAAGLSSNQIAEQLVLSPYTVNRHTQSIYGKLGINSRSAATRYALEHDLF